LNSSSPMFASANLPFDPSKLLLFLSIRPGSSPPRPPAAFGVCTDLFLDLLMRGLDAKHFTPSAIRRQAPLIEESQDIFFRNNPPLDGSQAPLLFPPNEDQFSPRSCPFSLTSARPTVPTPPFFFEHHDHNHAISEELMATTPMCRLITPVSPSV